jgi:hypothetical protein
MTHLHCDKDIICNDITFFCSTSYDFDLQPVKSNKMKLETFVYPDLIYSCRYLYKNFFF